MHVCHSIHLLYAEIVDLLLKACVRARHVVDVLEQSACYKNDDVVLLLIGAGASLNDLDRSRCRCSCRLVQVGCDQHGARLPFKC
jgi:hypothetical protein